MTTNLTAPAIETEATPALVTVELTDGKRPCGCSDGCPGLTTRYFSQGHDARMVTRLRDQVLAGRQELADAFAEVIKRGGTERLQIKLDAAVANARKPRKAKGKKAAKAKVIDTFELGEFCLAAMPLASSTNTVAKVGRWEYRGDLFTYQIVEDGKISKGDTVQVFEYDDKKGARQQTLSFTRVKVDEEFEASEPEVPTEPAEASGPRRVTNAGTPIPERKFAVDLPAQADIPF